MTIGSVENPCTTTLHHTKSRGDDNKDTLSSVSRSNPTTSSNMENNEYNNSMSNGDSLQERKNSKPPRSDFTLSDFSSLLEMTFRSNSVEEYQDLMYKMQTVRQHIVNSLLASQTVQSSWIEILRHTYNILNDSNTREYQRQMLVNNDERFNVNIKDEIVGLEKDLKFLDEIQALQEDNKYTALDQIKLNSILDSYHPTSEQKFYEECEQCVSFLRRFVGSAIDEGRKPIMITDWDGTMKDYCSQYLTNLQPIYSAVGMARFAESFTRLTAVLTAGPLRGPGILDLTSLPIDGPVVFSGSWGREWWLRGHRIVHDDGISSEGINALERVNEEMKSLLKLGEYSQFGLVGSGVQRKVDRLTLGVQTVCGHVHPELSLRKIDPHKQILHFDPSTELEVEIVVHNDGSIWNKANGVERLIKTVEDTLEPPGRVLICGDTASDLPMVQHAAQQNPQGVMSVFVGAKPDLQKRVQQIVGSPQNVCFVSCPDVIHASIYQLLRDPDARRGITQIPDLNPCTVNST
ncbi:putative trehalose-6-phosphate synthase 2 [Aphelenchoides bicaudatus]|nr:putative trehalose-6-phosphate synthase 2 [Aphelenchoides bicaudatus]